MEDFACTCITCSDQAVEMTVLAVDASGLARCADAAGVESEVDAALVDAAPGTRLMVHAGTAIAVAP